MWDTTQCDTRLLHCKISDVLKGQAPSGSAGRRTFAGLFLTRLPPFLGAATAAGDAPVLTSAALEAALAAFCCSWSSRRSARVMLDCFGALLCAVSAHPTKVMRRSSGCIIPTVVGDVKIVTRPAEACQHP